MPDRKDPNPDPFVREPIIGVRNPSRAEPQGITVSSTQPQRRACARIKSSNATQSISNSTPTTVTLNTAIFDTVGLLGTNRLVVPLTGRVSGPWLIHAKCTWTASGTGERKLSIVKNGSTTLTHSHIVGSTSEASQTETIIVYDPAPGEYYEMVVEQSSGAPLNLLTVDEHTFFEIIHLW